MEILSSPIWQFVGVVLAVLAIAISVFLYFKQRQFKSLSYAIVSITPLLSVHDEVRRRVKILYDEQPIQDVHLALIELFNSGKLPIASSDYEHPVTFDFGKNVKILSSEIIRTSPSTLPAAISTQAEKVVFNSILLNPEDSITIKVLLSEFKEQINVSGRIQGVKEIRRTVPLDAVASFRQNVKISLMVWGMLFLIGLSLTIFGTSGITAFGWGGMVGTLLFLVSALLSDYRKFKKSVGEKK
jgi:hypothetical protein